MIYGDQIKTDYSRQVDVIGEVTTAPAGNLVLRMGRLLESGGWERTGHIVLTPDEADQFVAEIQAKLREHLVGRQ